VCVVVWSVGLFVRAVYFMHAHTTTQHFDVHTVMFTLGLLDEACGRFQCSVGCSQPCQIQLVSNLVRRSALVR